MAFESVKMNRLSPIKKYKVTLLIIFSIWFASSLVAPFTVPAHSVNDLSGKASHLDNAQVWGKMNPFAATVYFLGDVFCAEISDHSFYLNGNQMPFCARCTAINVGLLIGILITLYFSPKINLVWLGLGLLPMVIDGGMELVSSYQSSNLLRVITGLLAGIVVSFYLAQFAERMLIQKDPIKLQGS
jgi:uncharacterized membrane protein